MRLLCVYHTCSGSPPWEHIPDSSRNTELSHFHLISVLYSNVAPKSYSHLLHSAFRGNIACMCSTKCVSSAEPTSALCLSDRNTTQGTYIPKLRQRGLQCVFGSLIFSFLLRPGMTLMVYPFSRWSWKSQSVGRQAMATHDHTTLGKSPLKYRAMLRTTAVFPSPLATVSTTIKPTILPVNSTV